MDTIIEQGTTHRIMREINNPHCLGRNVFLCVGNQNMVTLAKVLAWLVRLHASSYCSTFDCTCSTENYKSAILRCQLGNMWYGQVHLLTNLGRGISLSSFLICRKSQRETTRLFRGLSLTDLNAACTRQKKSFRCFVLWSQTCSP